MLLIGPFPRIEMWRPWHNRKYLLKREGGILLKLCKHPLVFMGHLAGVLSWAGISSANLLHFIFKLRINKMSQIFSAGKNWTGNRKQRPLMHFSHWPAREGSRGSVVLWATCASLYLSYTSLFSLLAILHWQAAQVRCCLEVVKVGALVFLEYFSMLWCVLLEDISPPRILSG